MVIGGFYVVVIVLVVLESVVFIRMVVVIFFFWGGRGGLFEIILVAMENDHPLLHSSPSTSTRIIRASSAMHICIFLSGNQRNFKKSLRPEKSLSP